MVKKNPKANVENMFLLPPCTYCKHLTNLGSIGPLDDRWTCKAFPTGIPHVILSRVDKHIKPLDFQEGDFVYESGVFDNGEGPRKVSFEGEWSDA